MTGAQVVDVPLFGGNPSALLAAYLWIPLIAVTALLVDLVPVALAPCAGPFSIGSAPLAHVFELLFFRYRHVSNLNQGIGRRGG